MRNELSPFYKKIHAGAVTFHGDYYTASLNAAMVTTSADLLSFLPVKSYLFQGDMAERRKSYARTGIVLLLMLELPGTSSCLFTGGQSGIQNGRQIYPKKETLLRTKS